MTRPLRPLLVVGTRPEAVKLAPVAHALTGAGHEPVVVVTGQHGEVLRQALGDLAVVPDHDLGLHRPGQTLVEVTTGVLEGVMRVLDSERPDAVVVQGDTTSAMAAALAAFYAGVPVVHLEAGLRTGDMGSPWPEEGNRRLLAPLADLHLAPTPRARDNLLREGIERDDVLVVGNTVVDALLHVVRQPQQPEHGDLVRLGNDPRRVVLVTAHRRESWGRGIAEIGQAVLQLARRHGDVVFLFPVHPNPAVRAALPSALGTTENVRLVAPLGYRDMAAALSRCYLVLTDSGGLQEEAPTLGRPVLVTRDVTERVEAVESGCARLVGTSREVVVAETERLLVDDGAYAEMAGRPNPFGDGAAAQRVVGALAWRYRQGARPDEFVAPGSAGRRPGLAA